MNNILDINVTEPRYILVASEKLFFKGVIHGLNENEVVFTTNMERAYEFSDKTEADFYSSKLGLKLKILFKQSGFPKFKELEVN